MKLDQNHSLLCQDWSWSWISKHCSCFRCLQTEIIDGFKGSMVAYKVNANTWVDVNFALGNTNWGADAAWWSGQLRLVECLSSGAAVNSGVHTKSGVDVVNLAEPETSRASEERIWKASIVVSWWRTSLPLIYSRGGRHESLVRGQASI